MVIEILDFAGLLLLVVVLALAFLYVRHALLRRGGAKLACAVRVGKNLPGRGWHFGVVRYTPRHLQWFRTFSVGWHPKYTFVRRSFEVIGRRHPRNFETHSVPYNAVVLHCRARTLGGDFVELELAVGERALMGMLAWLESVPPGAHQPPPSRRSSG